MSNDKPEEREPLLSGERLIGYVTASNGVQMMKVDRMSPQDVRDFYEDKITSGELIRRDELVTMLREAYDWGVRNIDGDGCHIDPPDSDFNDFLDHINKRP